MRSYNLWNAFTDILRFLLLDYEYRLPSKHACIIVLHIVLCQFELH